MGTWLYYIAVAYGIHMIYWPAILSSKSLQSVWRNSPPEQTALYLILFLYLSSCLPTPTHSFSSWIFQRMMRQVWWIVCWKPYSQELHSETAGREHQDPEVSPISFPYIYKQTKTHTENRVPILTVNNVLIPVRCSKIAVNPVPNLPTGCICFLFCFLKAECIEWILGFFCLGIIQLLFTP